MAEMDRRLSVCLTFDFDAMSVWIASTDNPALISRGEFGAVALSRILQLLDRHGIRGTFFVPGHTGLAYPALIRAIDAAGHEIGHHGWVHENPAAFELADERANFERGLEALQRTAHVTPVGFRSPAGDFSKNTIEVLLEYGIRYDATMSGSDFEPYYVRRGDQWSKTEPYQFGEPSELIAMPFAWALDDWPLFEFEPGWSVAQNPPSVVREIWQGEFDYAYSNCEGGVYIVTMHPQVIGRGSRLAMLEGFIEHMAGHPGVVFETCAAYEQRWRAAHPLAEWKDRPLLDGPTNSAGPERSSA